MDHSPEFSEEEMQVLLPLFLQSGKEYVSKAREIVERLRSGDAGPEDLELLHRTFHSAKGAALQIGFVHIGSLAKAMETVAAAMRSSWSSADEEVLSHLIEGLGVLEAYLQDLEAGRGSGTPPADLLGSLDEDAARLADGHAGGQARTS